MATRKSPAKVAPKRTYRPRAPKPMDAVGIVTVILNRTTGVVTIDNEFTNPLEQWAMLQRALDMSGMPLEIEDHLD